MTRRGRLAGLVAVFALLAGCSSISPPDDGPLRSKIDVDTPELRELKATTRIADCAPGTSRGTDDGLPSVTLPCLGGGPSVDVATLDGPMVINFWAVWCGPCRRELPIYQEFHEKYGDQVPVLGINFMDTQPGAALELAKESGITYPQLADPNSDLAPADPMPNLPALPGIAFVDADQKFVVDGVPQLIMHEVKSVDELKELVEKHLGIAL